MESLSISALLQELGWDELSWLRLVPLIDTQATHTYPVWLQVLQLLGNVDSRPRRLLCALVGPNEKHWCAHSVWNKSTFLQSVVWEGLMLSLSWLCLIPCSLKGCGKCLTPSYKEPIGKCPGHSPKFSPVHIMWQFPNIIHTTAPKCLQKLLPELFLFQTPIRKTWVYLVVVVVIEPHALSMLSLCSATECCPIRWIVCQMWFCLGNTDTILNSVLHFRGSIAILSKATIPELERA